MSKIIKFPASTNLSPDQALHSSFNLLLNNTSPENIKKISDDEIILNGITQANHDALVRASSIIPFDKKHKDEIPIAIENYIDKIKLIRRRIGVKKNNLLPLDKFKYHLIEYIQKYNTPVYTEKSISEKNVMGGYIQQKIIELDVDLLPYITKIPFQQFNRKNATNFYFYMTFVNNKTNEKFTRSSLIQPNHNNYCSPADIFEAAYPFIQSGVELIECSLILRYKVKKELRKNENNKKDRKNTKS